MEISDYNDIFKFIDLEYTIASIILHSGQRSVYLGKSNIDDKKIVIKICKHNKNTIGRIQREIRILNTISSDYFPKFYKDIYFSQETISNFIDNIDKNKFPEKYDRLSNNIPEPFFITFEEYIEHIEWNLFKEYIDSELKVVEFLVHIIKALKILWDKKIVHRDLKPPNILIRKNFTPVIIDLGAAKSLNSGTETLTLSGLAPCTVQFASPEQMDFSKRTEINYKSDQFAIGVIIYELLTNKFPYGLVDGDIYRFIGKLKTENCTNIKDLDENISNELAFFIHKLIEIEQFNRFRNIDTILSTLEALRSNNNENSSSNRS